MSLRETVPKIKRALMEELLSRGERVDGRGLMQYRDISIEAGTMPRANGSSVVRLGDTLVIAGVKLEMGSPYQDTPNQGALVVNAEFVPFASPSFEPGPPDENAIEVARIADRGIRGSGAVSLEELCIIPRRKAWILWVDIYVLDHRGNIIDACVLASLSALLNTKVPKVEVRGDEVKMVGEEAPLNVRALPIANTFAKIGDYVVVDPCMEEELVMDARLSFITTEWGTVCAVQKGLGGSFNVEEVFNLMERAFECAGELRGKVLASTSRK